ncbi:hypothetical protein PR048_003433 [Dryococelus australis]|uniref:Uncharacterized protein n=1 Tax=Dryococelus australis TaxID=614101 RepID=A0ABQ9IQ13_9NEOP|nr:hypothetical protein PR048_003433 [Dryococelus australis]
MVHVPSSFTGERCRGLLADRVRPFLHLQHLAEDLNLQQDNARDYCSRIAFLVPEVTRPHSKHVWDAAERAVRAVDPAPTDLRELWEAVQRSWISTLMIRWSMVFIVIAVGILSTPVGARNLTSPIASLPMPRSGVPNLIRDVDAMEPNNRAGPIPQSRLAARVPNPLHYPKCSSRDCLSNTGVCACCFVSRPTIWLEHSPPTMANRVGSPAGVAPGSSHIGNDAVDSQPVQNKPYRWSAEISSVRCAMVTCQHAARTPRWTKTSLSATREIQEPCHLLPWSRGGRAVSPLTSHHGEPGSNSGRVTGFSHVGGFFRGSPVSPALSFRRCSILTSITLIGSQDLAVKSLPNLHPLTYFFARVSEYVSLSSQTASYPVGDQPQRQWWVVLAAARRKTGHADMGDKDTQSSLLRHVWQDLLQLATDGEHTS